MEYCSVMKRNELQSYKETWMDLKSILLSERSQSEKAIDFMIPSMTFWKWQHYGERKKLGGYQIVRGEGEGGMNRCVLGQ